MNIVNFPESNKVFTAPKEDQSVLDLPVYIDEANTMKISCWEFTPNERLLTIFQNKIWLHIHLNIQPPVLITPEYPFTNDGIPPEKLEIMVEKMLERKIKQFLSKTYYEPDLNSGLYFSGETEMTELLKEFAKFIFEIPAE